MFFNAYKSYFSSNNIFIFKEILQPYYAIPMEGYSTRNPYTPVEDSHYNRNHHKLITGQYLI